MATLPDYTAPNFAKNLLTVGTTGVVKYAPNTVDAPAKNLGAYAENTVDLGWLDTDGLTESIARELNEFEPWNATGPIASRYNKEEFSFKFGVWSNSGLVNAMYYGVAASEMQWDDSGKVASFEQGKELPKPENFRLSFDILDGDKHRRFYLPAATITDREDLGYKKGELVKYGFTVKATLDPKLGYSIRREFKEGWKPGTSGSLNADAASGRDFGEWHTPAAG